jgi:tetratricopeptide (TPR) repeat protein
LTLRVILSCRYFMLTFPFARHIVFASVLLFVSSMRANGKDAWIEIRSPHFLVVSNASDHDARKVADQFEQFREVFQAAFPKLRVDLGKPLIIFALKNEDSMRDLVPEYWEKKGSIHPDGIYVPAADIHSVVVRTDVEASNPYHIIYHEYTHALMDLNFSGLPVWFSEGLAEFFGNSTLKDKDVQIGQISPAHLQVLQDSRLIPIDTLLRADHSSPYYNEQNRASVFYAESWAIVHYLMLDPDARKRQLLQNFLTSWDASGNQIDAAEKTFGDLTKFGKLMEAYVRQTSFFVAPVKTTVHADPKSYTARALSQSEIEAYRGEFYVRTNRPKEATESLELAVKADPNSTLAHEGLGLLALRQFQYQLAETELARAVELNSTNFVVYYYNARALVRSGQPGDFEKAVAALEKSIQLNPQFAPAYANVASLYSMKPETAAKGIAAARKAMQLEPGNFEYALSFGFVLVNAGKLDDAKVLASRLMAAAKTPVEQSHAIQLSDSIGNRQMRDAKAAALADNAASSSAPRAPVTKTEAAKTDVTKPEDPTISVSPTIPTGSTTLPPTTPGAATTSSPLNGGSTSFSVSGYQPYALEGQVATIDCAKSSDGRLGLRTHSVIMEFHYRDLKEVKLSTSPPSATTSPATANTATQSANAAKPEPACGAWKNRKVRVVFYPTPELSFDGELLEIQFF